MVLDQKSEYFCFIARQAGSHDWVLYMYFGDNLCHDRFINFFPYETKLDKVKIRVKYLLF